MQAVRAVLRQPAYVLGLIALVAVLLYNRSFVNPANFAGYWVSTFTNASIFLIFSCPVGSASAAIAAARARRAGIWSLPLARGRVVITLRLLLPPFVAALAVQLFGLYVLASATWGAPGRIPFEVVLAWVSILTFHICVGYLLGRFLPLAVSIPLAIFFSYCWLGFTWAVDYFPIRYLAGLIITACCSVDTVLDERAIVAVVVFSLGMSVALLLLATTPPRGSHWSAGLVAAVAAVAFALVAVIVGINASQGLSSQPVAARGRADLLCTGDSPTICVYPEQLQGHDPRPTLATAYHNLRDAGVALPAEVTTSNSNEDRSSLRVVVTTRPTTLQLVYTISAALLPDDVAPYCGDGSDYSLRLDDASVAMWWLQKTAGKGLVSESEIPLSSLSENSESLVQRFRLLSPQAQREWYFGAAPGLLDCTSKPIGVPGP